MIRNLAIGAIGLASTLASAEPKKTILVLRSDGNADATLRARVDAAVLKLAKTSDGQVTAGDISYVDAAAATGCKPELPACKDDILATFATDELVMTTITRKPGTLEVSVRRATRGAAPREVTAMVADGGGDLQLDGIGVLFAATTRPGTMPEKPPEPIAPIPVPPVEPALVAPVEVAPAPLAVTPMPAPQDGNGSRRGLQIAGMVGGGVVVLIGFGLWGSAGDVQSDIDAAPKRTTADFTKLRDLEARGDTLATWGNVMFISGVALAGVSTYLFFRDRRRDSNRTATITPTLFDHGGGIALTFGALP